MNQHEKINYVEFPSRDIAKTKAFFGAAFGWTFSDYGPDYVAFSNEGLNGGFFRADMKSSTADASACANPITNPYMSSPVRLIYCGKSQISKQKADDIDILLP